MSVKYGALPPSIMGFILQIEHAIGRHIQSVDDNMDS